LQKIQSELKKADIDIVIADEGMASEFYTSKVTNSSE